MRVSRYRGRRAWRSSTVNWAAMWSTQMVAAQLPLPVREHQGIPGRGFRFDFAWPELKIAAEVEGGIWAGPKGAKRGAHSHAHPLGISRDIEKYNLAAIHGWRVIRASSAHIRDGLAIQWLAALHGIFKA